MCKSHRSAETPFAWQRSWGCTSHFAGALRLTRLHFCRTCAGLAAAKATQSFYENHPEVVNHFCLFCFFYTQYDKTIHALSFHDPQKEKEKKEDILARKGEEK